MAQLAQHNQHWRDAAIERSEVITDAWEVTKIVTGRLAEWILFGCMIANIVGILPGVALPVLVTNIVMGVQIVTLDIAGFGLATMAENARANGAEKAAKNAQRTAYLLIGIMMVTLILFSLGLMVPSIHQYTDIAEKVLILVRVGLIVLYGHVIHSLRRVALPVHTPPQSGVHPVDSEQFNALVETVSRLSITLTEVNQAVLQLAKNAEDVHKNAPTSTPTGHMSTICIHEIKPLNMPIKIGISPCKDGKKMLTLISNIISTEDDENAIVEGATSGIDVDVKRIEAPNALDYPIVSGIAQETVKRVIDEHRVGVKWRDMSGNYSRTIKPIRDAWEVLHRSASDGVDTDVHTDKHPVYSL